MKRNFKRRDFLKAGIGGSGLIAAGRAAPSTVTATSQDKKNLSVRPWWVKIIDKPAGLIKYVRH